jgi:hypothetical protein
MKRESEERREVRRIRIRKRRKNRRISKSKAEKNIGDEGIGRKEGSAASY